MPTIIMPASDLRPGDKINFGGNPATVQYIDKAHAVSVYVRWLWDGNLSIISFQKALILTVERPEPVDPDADLIEAMAKAIHDTYQTTESTVEEWGDASEGVRSEYRRAARAALAVVRAAK